MKYFTIEELSKTNTGLPNIPDAAVIKNLNLLVDNVLDKLRELYGKPIKVNSAYRSPIVNRKVGGAPNSEHIDGHAADITAGSKAENKILFDLIKEHLPYNQLINEKDYSWIHISFREHGNKKQILAIK